MWPPIRAVPIKFSPAQVWSPNPARQATPKTSTNKSQPSKRRLISLSCKLCKHFMTQSGPATPRVRNGGHAEIIWAEIGSVPVLDCRIEAESGMFRDWEVLDESKYETPRLLILRNGLHSRRHRAHQMPRWVPTRLVVHQQFYRVSRHARQWGAPPNCTSVGA